MSAADKVIDDGPPNSTGRLLLGLVLAAAAGRRFVPPPKQLARLSGWPLVEYLVAALQAASLAEVDPVLGAYGDTVRAGADLAGAEVVVCADWPEGQSASLRAGVTAAERRGADAVVVVLGDQPWISADAVRAVAAARSPGAVAARASYAGKPGHPTLLERSLFPALRALDCDRGARDALADRNVVTVPCDDLGSPADVDTPADLSAGANADAEGP